MLVHSVYFWLRDDLTSEEQQTFTSSLESLLTIPTVRHGFIGRPSATDRPVIDRSYSYGLVVVFDDMEGHDAYQVDPVHEAFKARCSSLWSSIRIYDFED